MGGVVVFGRWGFVGVGVLGVDGYIGFWVGCGLERIKGVKFWVRVVWCSGGGKGGGMVEYLGLVRVFFGVYIMRLKNVVRGVGVKGGLGWGVESVGIVVLDLYFGVRKIGV